MGVHFPSVDPRWKDAPSLVFLQAVARFVAQSGYVVGNVDATIIAQEPRLGPYLELMRTGIAQALDLPVEAVSVKAKSTDGLGAIGRGEGIAAQAVVLVSRRE
jgi:2-C-methyl-D-erythritol 2,4-cyclodiphosphate synthase